MADDSLIKLQVSSELHPHNKKIGAQIRKLRFTHISSVRVSASDINMLDLSKISIV